MSQFKASIEFPTGENFTIENDAKFATTCSFTKYTNMKLAEMTIHNFASSILIKMNEIIATLTKTFAKIPSNKISSFERDNFNSATFAMNSFAMIPLNAQLFANNAPINMAPTKLNRVQ